MSCVRLPDVHYQLRELATGRTVDGVLYSEKGMRYESTAMSGHAFANQAHGRGARDYGTTGGLSRRRRIPQGDTLVFAEHVPLQVRKDMLAVLVYRFTMSSLDNFRSDCDDMGRIYIKPPPPPSQTLNLGGGE